MNADKKQTRNKFTKFLLSCLLFMGLTSCGEEVFTTKSESDGYVSSTVTTNTTSTCSSFTLVRPKVDFLFLWDNSTSTVFINDSTKEALANVIDNISDRFDYHIMLSPLIVDDDNDVNYQSKLIAYNTDGLSSEATSMMISPSKAATTLSGFDLEGGSLEEGVDRAVKLIKNNSVANSGNGIFRAGSYLYVVVMSNQDDNSWQEGKSPTPSYGGSYFNSYVSEQVEKLLCLRGSYSGSCTGFSLNSTQLRFMNITAFSDSSGTCTGVSSWKKGQTYQTVSQKVYSQTYVSGGTVDTDRQIDQDDRSDGLYDSYNICDGDSFTTIFDGINSSINQSIVAHKYDYWPVATSGADAIDPDEVEVYKDGSSVTRLSEPVSDSSASGFTFTNEVVTVDTRYEPTSGEEFTGYVVKLYGDARVTYPECMLVKTQSAKEYFGYVALSTKPLESTIVLTIDGKTIEQSTTNGWELIKSNGEPVYYTNKNIKITSQTDYTAATPAVNKSGYMLKLYGSAVFGNGSTVNVTYDPTN